MRNPDNPSTLDAVPPLIFPQIKVHDLAHKDLVVHGGPMRRTIPFSGPFTTAEACAAGLTSGILRGPSVRRLIAGVYVRAEVEVSEQILVAAALKVVPQAVVVGITALHLHGVDIGPPKPLYLVRNNPHPVRRAGLNVARVGALPPHSGSVAVAEHAFASAASRLNLLDLVPGDGCRHAATARSGVPG